MGVSLIMTVGVYGFVALIVKLDDMGFYLQRNQEQSWLRSAQRRLGDGLVAFAPRLMKALTVIGTAAMFLVGGGILSHGVHAVSEFATHKLHKMREALLGLVAYCKPLFQA